MIQELTKPRYDVDIADEPDIDVLLDKQANDYLSAREAAERLNLLEAENKRLREALEQLAEPTNWESEAHYTYETGSIDVDGNPQEREGRVELGIDIVWCGETSKLPKEIARAALDTPARP